MGGRRRACGGVWGRERVEEGAVPVGEGVGQLEQTVVHVVVRDGDGEGERGGGWVRGGRRAVGGMEVGERRGGEVVEDRGVVRVHGVGSGAERGDGDEMVGGRQGGAERGRIRYEECGIWGMR